MRTGNAAIGSFVFLLLVPGVVAGLVPWWLTGWHVRGSSPYYLPLRVAGMLLVAAGVVALLHAFVRFVVEGLGTPAPVAPTENLVVGGLYRYVRNPMYLASPRSSSGRHSYSDSSSCSRTQPASCSPLSCSFTSTRSRRCGVSSARSTRPTGRRCPVGGHVVIRGRLTVRPDRSPCQAFRLGSESESVLVSDSCR
jgi:hypothetical protein